MDKTKTGDIMIRILAIILSLILWIYVTSEQNPERTAEISDIPVKITNVDALSQSGLIMVGGTDGYKIKVSVKGRSKDVLALKPQDFTAEANLGAGYRTKGVNSVPVQILDYPAGIDISNQALYITVELDELVQKSFPVTSAINVKAKDGYAVLTPTIKPQEVIIRGAAKYIGTINSVVTKYEANDATANIQASMPVQVLDKNGNAVKGIECTPKTIDISVPVRKAKELPVNIKTTGSLPSGTSMKGITVSPDTISVIGDDAALDAVKSIDTVAVNLSDITQNTVKPVKLNIPQGISVVGGIDTVNVSVAVETTVERSFSVSVNYSNLSGELKAELLTNNITVTLRAQQSVMDKIVPGDLSAIIDLSGAPSDGGEFEYTPSITVPQGTEMIGSAPSKIKVRISKKQG